MFCRVPSNTGPGAVRYGGFPVRAGKFSGSFPVAVRAMPLADSKIAHEHLGIQGLSLCGQ